jgi:hypothetical protein
LINESFISVQLNNGKGTFGPATTFFDDAPAPRKNHVRFCGRISH